MDSFTIEEIESFQFIHDLAIKYYEAFLVEDGSDNNSVVMSEKYYTNLLESIAKLDKSLQNGVMLAIGGHASGWDDDTVNSKEVADSVGISLELFLQVCDQIEDGGTIFRAVDDECCLLSPYGWERYELLLKDQYQNELFELAHPKLIYDEGGDPALATSEGLYRCKTVNGAIQDFDTLYDQLKDGQDIQGELVQYWGTMSLAELSFYSSAIEEY